MTHIDHSEKVIVMKVFLTVLIFFFSLQSFTKADDIRDFQIEGMSAGDSLLDYFSKKKIKKAIKSAYYYPDRKFRDIFIKPSSSSKFDMYQISLKSKDKNYIIYTLTGQIGYENNIKDCYPQKKEIVAEIKNVFGNKTEIKNYTIKHSVDKSGKSKVESTDFLLQGGSVQVQCYDWSKNVEYTDKLLLNIKTDEALDYFRNAFK